MTLIVVAAVPIARAGRILLLLLLLAPTAAVTATAALEHLLEELAELSKDQ